MLAADLAQGGHMFFQRIDQQKIRIRKIVVKAGGTVGRTHVNNRLRLKSQPDQELAMLRDGVARSFGA